MKFWAWGATVAAIGAAQSVMVACGGSGNGSGSGGAGGALSASSSSTASSTSSGSAVGAECAMKLTRQDCFTCCESDFMMANEALITNLVTACACAVPDGGVADGGVGTPCASDPMCQMECTDMMINNGCITCVNDKAIGVKPQDPCVAAGYKSCAADPTCAPLPDCANMYCTQAM